MQRIAILGCGGSGKTTIGRQLAEQVGVPITHLDAVCYDDQWNKMNAEEFVAVQEELVSADRWVIVLLTALRAGLSVIVRRVRDVGDHLLWITPLRPSGQSSRWSSPRPYGLYQTAA